MSQREARQLPPDVTDVETVIIYGIAVPAPQPHHPARVTNRQTPGHAHITTLPMPRGSPRVLQVAPSRGLFQTRGISFPGEQKHKMADALADPIARRPGIIRHRRGGVALKFVSRLIRPTIVTGMMAALIYCRYTYRGTAGVRDYLDAGWGGMDRHARLSTSVAAFTAPARNGPPPGPGTPPPGAPSTP